MSASTASNCLTGLNVIAEGDEPHLSQEAWDWHTSDVTLAALAKKCIAQDDGEADVRDMDDESPIDDGPRTLWPPSGSSPFAYDDWSYIPQTRRPSKWVEAEYAKWKAAQTTRLSVPCSSTSCISDNPAPYPVAKAGQKRTVELDESVGPSSKRRRRGCRGQGSSGRRTAVHDAVHRSKRGGVGSGGPGRLLEQVEVAELGQTRSDLGGNGSSYIGPNPERVDLKHRRQNSSLKKLVDEGFVVIPNNPSKAQVIVGNDGIPIVTKARPPQHPQWGFVVQSVDNAMAQLERELGPSAAKPDAGIQRMDPQRPYKRIGSGFSFGGGQPVPGFLHVRNEHHPCLRAFLSDPDVLAFADHMRECYRFHNPKLYQLGEELRDDIKTWDPSAEATFPGLPMFAQTVNVGPQTVTIDHTDPKNARFGHCIIAAFGTFDCRTSGHLVLHDLKRILELRAGDVAFIPSAVLTHSNVSILEDEVRRSWTLYTAGGLYRFRDAGFRTVSSMRPAVQRVFAKRARALLEERLKLHMTVAELREHHLHGRAAS